MIEATYMKPSAPKVALSGHLDCGITLNYLVLTLGEALVLKEALGEAIRQAHADEGSR